MGRFDELKRLKDATTAKLADENLRPNLAQAAGEALLGAASVIEVAEAVAERSGLTKKNGDISKVKVARAALQPTKTAKTLLGAAAEEVQARRRAGETTNG